MGQNVIEPDKAGLGGGLGCFHGHGSGWDLVQHLLVYNK